MSNLGKFNFYLIQWLFVRVARMVHENETVGWYDWSYAAYVGMEK